MKTNPTWLLRGYKQSFILFLVALPLLFCLSLFFSSSLESVLSHLSVDSDSGVHALLVRDQHPTQPLSHSEIQQILNAIETAPSFSMLSGQGAAAGYQVLVGTPPSAWNLEAPNPIRLYTRQAGESFRWKLPSGEILEIQSEESPISLKTTESFFGYNNGGYSPLLLLSPELWKAYALELENGSDQGMGEILHNLHLQEESPEALATLRAHLPERIAAVWNDQSAVSEWSFLLFRILPTLLLSLLIMSWLTYQILRARLHSLIRKSALLRMSGSSTLRIAREAFLPFLCASILALLTLLRLKLDRTPSFLALALLFHLLFLSGILLVLYRNLRATVFQKHLM